MATSIAGTLQYWLANHPIIVNFSWNPGQTPGASPFFVAGAVLSYLSVIIFLTRLPLPVVNPGLIRPIKVLHSSLLFVLSATMAAGCILSTVSHSPPGRPHWVFCYPPGTQPSGPVFFWAYIFYLSKLLEFGDTLLIILGGSAGRHRRLTFLHVYHHCMVVPMCYNALRTAQSLFPLLIAVNASVHVMMYGYYTLCAVGLTPKWKRAVTECQIAQFKISFLGVLVVLYYHFFGGGCSGTWSWCFNFLLNSSLLILFLDFHGKTYGGFHYDFKNKRL